MTGNPFIDAAEAEPNPFMTAAEVVPVQDDHCGDPACARKHRPGRGGEHYSTDIKERNAQLVQEGRMGPQFGGLSAGNSKKKKRALELVAEQASERAQEINDALFDGLSAEQPQAIRMQAAKEILKSETEHEAMVAAQRKEIFEDMNKRELVDEITKMMGELRRAGQLADSVLGTTDEEPVDAVVVE